MRVHHLIIGVTCVITYLNIEYDDRWIGREGPIPWPVKKKFVEKVQSYEDLRSKKNTVFSEIQIMLKNNLSKCTQLCNERNGTK